MGKGVEIGWTEMSQKRFKCCCGQAGVEPQAYEEEAETHLCSSGSRPLGKTMLKTHLEQVPRFPLARKKRLFWLTRRGI